MYVTSYRVSQDQECEIKTVFRTKTAIFGLEAKTLVRDHVSDSH